MCGITGIFAFNEKGKHYLKKINSATNSLQKRGPDNEGISKHNNIALGHRRLSIIDTSDAASQPLTDSSGRFTICFNGEIFNYKQLRSQLTSSGVKFKSESDTEVLLYMYVKHKEKCLEQLDGEFAFAIYDKETESVFLARDRFGIKPLYYYKTEDVLVFASELKSIMCYDIPKVIDEASLQTYLHLNYIPSPYSIFKNVLKLKAGFYLNVNKNGTLSLKQYYELPKVPTIENIQENTNYESAKQKLKSLLEESVINRMVSDVPLGTFLSGGIDSSIITAIAALNTKNLNTFSVGYKNEPLFDETHYAKLVAKKYNTNHTVFELSNDDLFGNLHKVLDYIDEPFADSSALAVNILSMQTKKHVSVALSGDGADEIFAGYNKHAAELIARTPSLTKNIVKASHRILKNLPKSRNSKIGNKIRQLEKFADGISLNEQERYWRWAGFSTDTNTHEVLLKKNEHYLIRKNEILKNINANYNSILYTDIQLVLENDMLVKVDRMSMSNSLEVRVPFLDHKIVDFAFTLPTNFKIDKNQQKKILKDAFKDYLPDELYNRKKQGFEVPLLKWFKTDLKSMITDDLLKDSFIINHLDI